MRLREEYRNLKTALTFIKFRDAEKWSKSIHVENVAQLNKTIQEGRGGDLIRICEAHQENQIRDIANEINAHADRIKLILIAGPSSSGKTTWPRD